LLLDAASLRQVVVDKVDSSLIVVAFKRPLAKWAAREMNCRLYFGDEASCQPFLVAALWDETRGQTNLSAGYGGKGDVEHRVETKSTFKQLADYAPSIEVPVEERAMLKTPKKIIAFEMEGLFVYPLIVASVLTRN